MIGPMIVRPKQLFFIIGQNIINCINHMTINELIKQLDNLREKEGNCKIVIKTYIDYRDQDCNEFYRVEKAPESEDRTIIGTLED